MTWNVYWFDLNEKKFQMRNVFKLSARFNEELEILKAKRPLMTKEEFVAELARIARYCYWAKCEYEFLLCDFPTEQKKIKVDVFHQLSMNWEQFSNYVWENI